jgi:hypothetical protein
MVEAAMTEAPVNSIKLTKLEKSVLKALAQPCPREHSKGYPEGSDEYGIAATVWGSDVLNTEKRGGYFCGDVSLAYAARSSLSRVLKRLLFRGLVKKCKPVYQRGWVRGMLPSGEKYGYYGLAAQFLRAPRLSCLVDAHRKSKGAAAMTEPPRPEDDRGGETKK